MTIVLRRAWSAVVLAILVTACRGPSAPVTGIVVITTNASAAIVTIDDRAVGIAKDLRGGVRLSAGSHRVLLDADGFVRAYRVVEIPSNGIVRLDIELSPELP